MRSAVSLSATPLFGSTQNGAAEFAVLEHYAHIPASLDFAGAAGLPVAVETAARTLDLLEVTEGQTVLNLSPRSVPKKVISPRATAQDSSAPGVD